MKRLLFFALPPCLFLTQAALATTLPPFHPADSVGVERKGGKQFVLHRVDQGQTLYSVARRYHSSVDAIKAANADLTDNVLRYDQLLRVPVTLTADGLARQKKQELEKGQKKEEEKAKPTEETTQVIAETTTPATKTDAKNKPERTTSRSAVNGIHQVETGQTLYSLAVRYNVTMADIRRWNDLGADALQAGQSLIVTERAYETKKGDSTPAATQTRPASAKPTEGEAGRTTDVTPPKTRSASARATDSATAKNEVTRLEAKPIITPEPLPTPGTRPKTKPADAKPAETKTSETRVPETKPAETKAPERTSEPKTTEPRSDNEPAATARKGYFKSDIGFADLIEGNDVSTKYLALHRSAPVGTLVQVRNDITNQSLYVKVIGKLPDTGINNQVLIRLSARAFEKLSPNGQRFRAEVSYSN